MTYSKGDYGPFIDEVIRAYSSQAVAATGLRQTVHAASRCSSFTNKEGTWHLSPLSFPKIGQRDFALQFTLKYLTDGAPYTQVYDYVYFLEGQVTVALDSHHLEGFVSGSNRLAPLAREADQRVSRRFG